MHHLVFSSSKYNNNSSCQNNNNNNKTSVQVKSLGIGQGPEPQLVVKATQSATLVSASHLSFSARTQHADSAVHNDTHNKYIILHNATLSFSSLPVQCPAMIWSQFFQLYRFLFGHIHKRSGIARQVSFKKGKYFYSAEYFPRVSISLKWIKFVLS